MASKKTPPRKFFTLDEANAMMPVVRAIDADLAVLARALSDRRDRLAGLLAGRQFDELDPYDAELLQIEEELRRDANRMKGYVEELRELGLEPKDASEGLVDFPSLHEGRPVQLCWKLDEPKVAFWHEVDAGFEGRQPVEQTVGPRAAERSETHLTPRAGGGRDAPSQNPQPADAAGAPRLATNATAPTSTPQHGKRLGQGPLAAHDAAADAVTEEDPLQRGNRPVKFGLGPEPSDS